MTAKLAKRANSVTMESESPVYDPYEINEMINSETLSLWDGWSSEHTLPNHITDAAKKSVGEHERSVPFGFPELRKAIAEKLEADNGIEVDHLSEVLVTTGGIEAEHLAIWTLIEPGDEVIMADPEYRHSYEPNVVMAGGKMVYVSLKEERGFKLDPEDIEKKLTTKTKMIVIITPGNPTGAILDKKDLEGIADITRKKNLIVLSDEVFEKLVYDGKKNISIGSFPDMEKRTLTLNSFSKSWNMASFRIGYIAGPREIIKRMANLQIHVTTCVSEVSQAAALAALQGPKDWLDAAVKAYEARRRILVEQLNRIKGVRCLTPDGGRCGFPNVAYFHMATLEFVKHILREANVLLMPAVENRYGVNAVHHVKVGFCRPEKTIREAMERIRAVLERSPI